MMKDNCKILVILLCLFPLAASAQSFEEFRRQQQETFNSFVQKTTEEFRAYRDRVNAEYAEFMRRAWKREEAEPAKPLPKRPEPPKPEVRNPLEIPQFDAIPFGEVRDIKLPDLTKPEPVIPIDQLEGLVFTAPEKVKPEPEPEPKQEVRPQEVPKQEVKPKEEVKLKKEPKQEVKPVPKLQEAKPENLAFMWCGLTWNVPLGKQHKFRLNSTKEADVANAWETLSGAKYGPVVAACLKARDAHQLPDWGYLHFLEAMTNAFLPGMPNEARLLEMFILVQSGYQVRIARADDQLFLLIPSYGDIYEYSSLTIGGRTYYVADKKAPNSSYYVYERDFPKEKPFVWQMKTLPILSSEDAIRTLQGQRYSMVQATVDISKGLIAFMNDYPRCNDWNGYALASLSDQAKKRLYPALQQHIRGKAKKEGAAILLDFVQTAFKYKTDEEQFGVERPLFGDETLFYPFCDCEDRSILYSILVHDLLELDVVLLNYPNHLATAVCFDQDVQGDYVMLNGHRYVVCDPTYIGGHVGEAMSRYKQTKATILRIYH